MTDPEKYIFVADDFTGATDTLATLARSGLTVRLFLGVPKPGDVRGLDAFGIATEARALGNEEMVALMEEIGRELVPHRPQIVHLKICSTFDSAPETGNFALAMDSLRNATGIQARAIIGGQPSLGRYCIFGHLFARAADGRTYRIDRHPVMKSHPVTPMIESDLVQHCQVLGGVTPTLMNHVSLQDQNGLHPLGLETITLFDAVDDYDIASIGTYLRANMPIVCTGASSVAEAVVGSGQRRLPERIEAHGPVLVFVGSRSSVSAEQVRQADGYRTFALSPAQITDASSQRAMILAPSEALHAGENVLIYLDESAPSGTPRDLAQSSAALVSALLKNAQVGALAIAGGDTSSAIICALRPRCIAYRGDIDHGVSLCMAEFEGNQCLPIVLKGGQVGRPGLFDHLIGEIFR